MKFSLRKHDMMRLVFINATLRCSGTNKRLFARTELFRGQNLPHELLAV